MVTSLWVCSRLTRAGASERIRLATVNESLREDMDRLSKECVTLTRYH